MKPNMRLNMVLALLGGGAPDPAQAAEGSAADPPSRDVASSARGLFAGKSRGTTSEAHVRPAPSTHRRTTTMSSWRNGRVVKASSVNGSAVGDSANAALLLDVAPVQTSATAAAGGDAGTAPLRALAKCSAKAASVLTSGGTSIAQDAPAEVVAS
mmetsp:Transcript_104080/g.303861  ORF Transcript_104080/g.303861 Transcript_104080/m.303861 type:complete len:155 (+) Transcript_104080:2096-2560(+)